MDATELLEKDHDRMRALFSAYAKLEDRNVKEKTGICAQIISVLEIHAALEEEIFYPALKKKRSSEVKDEVAEGLEEHLALKRLMADLKGMKPEDEQYDAKVKVLGETNEHHIKEEEEDMFARARKILSPQELNDLATQMSQRKNTK